MPPRAPISSTISTHNKWQGFTQFPDIHPHRAALVIILVGLFARAWLADATFFNADEAWHYSTAIQNSVREAWHASLSLYHPPLLVFVLYFWRKLGTSDLMLRLPCVISGALFCWFYYKWLKLILGPQAALVGLLLVTFLPTMIGISADLRQYPLMLMFTAAGVYFLEDALRRDNWPEVLLSGVSLLLGMLSHYSGFLVAAALGLYVIFLFLRGRVSRRLFLTWIPAQVAGVALAWFFYVVQISKLAAARGNESARLMANWYLPQFYYHPGHDNLARFLFKGTFGIFRFTFAWVVIGHVATLMFFAGLILFLRRRDPETRSTALLMFLPFLVSWMVAAAGLYPYGRTRHSIFLAMFGIAGMSIAIEAICRRKTGRMVAFAAGIVLLCQVSRAQPWLDMLPLADRRHELMDQAIQLIRTEVSPTDVIYVDKATEFQVRRYLCGPEPIAIDRSVSGFESFQCSGVHIISSFPKDDAVLAATFPDKWTEMAHAFGLPSGSKVWVVEGGWISGFAEMLRTRYPELPILDVHHYGHYLEIFDLPVSNSAR